MFGKMVLALALLALGEASAQAGEDVLARVRHNGQLRCAVDMTPGFSQIASNGEATGFDVDFCRAVAAAALGDPSLIATQRISSANKYKAVSSGEVDLGLGMSTWTMGRDYALGTHFPVVMFNDGQGFVAWKDSGIKRLADAKGASVCVQGQTTSIDTLKSTIARNGWPMTVLELPSSEEKWNAFSARKCTLVTGDRSELAARRATMASDPGRWVLLPDTISREPLGPVVSAGDDRWFTIVRWVVLVTQIAEARGVTSENIDALVDGGDSELARLAGHDPDFGKALGLDPQWAKRVIRQVGNYAEIYNRNLGPGTPISLERGQNALWSDGGLFYPPPLR
jgi:general L-amino acid transport system substrate-binding protein